MILNHNILIFQMLSLDAQTTNILEAWVVVRRTEYPLKSLKIPKKISKIKGKLH